MFFYDLIEIPYPTQKTHHFYHKVTISSTSSFSKTLKFSNKFLKPHLKTKSKFYNESSSIPEYLINLKYK